MSEAKTRERQVCLNCGAELGDAKFCPECGQSAMTSRFTLKNLGVNVLTGLSRVNDKFFYTCWLLLSRPWKVISDYIGGKRTRYTGPVQMMIIIAFISLTLNSLFGVEEEPANFTFLKDTGWLSHFVNVCVNYLYNSEVAFGLMMLLPVVPLLYLTHRLFGIRRFNAAEYIIAALYLSDAFMLTMMVILNIFDLLTGETIGLRPTSYLLISICYIGVLGVISIYKSLGSSGKSGVRKILMSSFFIVFTLFLYILALVVLYVVHHLSLYGHI